MRTTAKRKNSKAASPGASLVVIGIRKLHAQILAATLIAATLYAGRFSGAQDLGGYGDPVVDLQQSSGALPFLQVYGDDTLDGFGFDSDSIAFGDVNGDGFDDLIVGAVEADAPGGTDAGVVYIIYGSADRTSDMMDLNTDGAISAADTGWRNGPTIAIDWPTASSEWSAGTVGQIHVKCGNFPSDGLFYLDLWKDGSYVRYLSRVPFEVEAGEIPFRLPATVVPGTGYQIRLSRVDDTGICTKSGEFTVTPMPASRWSGRFGSSRRTIPRPA